VITWTCLSFAAAVSSCRPARVCKVRNPWERVLSDGVVMEVSYGRRMNKQG
jgi:hypothetical protein